MRRSKAQSVNETTKKINESVRNYEQLKSVGEIIPETFSRILSNGFYQLEDIITVGNCLLKKYDCNFEQQFIVADKLDQIKKFIKLNHAAIENHPIFVIYNKCGDGTHWVTFSITKLDSKIFVLYKDSFGEIIPDDLKQIIDKHFVENVVEFKNNTNKEQNDHNSCGPMALKNMTIILQGLRNKKQQFIRDWFEKMNFCSQNEVDQVKNEFLSALNVELVLKLINDKEYENFKEALIEFVDMYANYASSYKPLKKYIDLVIEELRKYENDPNYTTDDDKEEEIETARKTFFEDSHMENILNEQEKNFEMKNNKDYKIETKLTKTFPAQQKKFIAILSYLKISNNFEKDLKEVSQKLNINPNKMKLFLEILKEETVENKKKNIFLDIAKNCITIKDLPPYKENITPETDVKSLEQLLAEIEFGIVQETSTNFENEEEEDTSEEESKEYYRAKYKNNETILKLEANYYKVQAIYQQWKDKNIQDIYKWACGKKGNLRLPGDLNETLAIMNRANELATGGHNLRIPQILTVLLFGQPEKENQGKLNQIQTGEGKTIIVSLLATLKALQGFQVDVITSNQILAREGVKNRANFYNMFGISVADNNPEEKICKIGPRPCYTANVVYGTMGNFQFDYLRDLFENFGIRAKRRFDFAILDEVDSMTIDQGSYIAKLAAPFPGMDLLKYVFIKIWQELIKAEKSIDNYLNEKIIKKTTELSNANLTEAEKEKEYENYQLKICKTVTEEVKNKIKEGGPLSIKLIPKHLKQFCEDMLDKWIDNALYARYYCQENEQYVVKPKNGEDVIIPVDYLSTGVTLKNTIWSNGLHQFVQLNHNLNVTAESLTSSSISNIGYIKLYNNNIFGLTGTLGSVAEQNLLSTIYNIDYTRIPTYKMKKFIELEGVVIEDQQWANAIALTSLLIGRQGRSTLIICRTIKDLQHLATNIESLKELEGFKELKIKTYPDEDSSQIVNEEVGQAEVIIATNIAGRGTDFKTSSDLEKKGGLYVCLSFLPVNQRVQDQAFGRTSRQGNNGSAQLIIRASDVLLLDMEILPEMSFSTIIQKRDEIEKLRLENIKTEKLNEIDFQDNIVKSFAELYKTFKVNCSEKSGGIFIAEDLKEFWAFWLHKKNFKGTENVEEEFKKFKHDAKSILEGKITHNPYYSIRQAEYFLSNNQAKEARQALNHAMALNKGKEEFLYSAYMKFFEVAIEQGEQIKQRLNKAIKKILFVDIFTDIQRDDSYKECAERALEKTKTALETEINYIQKYMIGETTTTTTTSFPIIVDATTSKPETPTNIDFLNILLDSKENVLVKHIISRHTTLTTFLNHAESLIEQIKNSGNDKTTGTAIAGRIPNYLQNLPQQKAIHDAELSELSLIGLDIIYVLKDVHDVPDKVIKGARLQIGGGLTALGMGVAFPISMPVMGQIAAAMISEGLMDIVLELLSHGDSTFNKKAYIKGKCISYGITVATMGLNAILTCTKILDKAINACRSLSEMLRGCPRLTALCEKLATLIERVAAYLTELKLAAEYLNVQRAGQAALTRMSLFKTGLKNIAKVTVSNVMFSLATDKLLTMALDKILENIQPYIQAKVTETVNENIQEEDLKFIKKDEMKNLICDITTGTYGEIAVDVLGDISISLFKQSKSWKVKIATIGIESVMTTYKIKTYAKNCLDILKKRLQEINKENLSENNAHIRKELKDLTIMMITQHIYELIMQLTLKCAHTFAVNPLVKMIGKLREQYCETTEHTSIVKQTNGGVTEGEDFLKILTAYEILGLEPGASVDEITKTANKLFFKYHPDRHGPEASKQRFQEVLEAKQLLLNHLKPQDTTHRSNRQQNFNNQNNQQTNNGFNQQTTNDFNQQSGINRSNPTTPSNQQSNNNLPPAHIGNIKTLSQRHRQHIVVQSRNGKIIAEFGRKYQERPPLITVYIPPSSEVIGHYIVPENIAREHNINIRPTGVNNCFYDVYSALQRVQGIVITPFEARTLAEEPNLTNFTIGVLNQTSKIFNNTITRNIYLSLQEYLLVGGFKNLLIHVPPPNDTTFVERCEILCKKQPTRFGGSYSQVALQFPKRRGIIEVHHIPSVSAYTGTMYKNISRNRMPAIAIEYAHHRDTVGRIGVTSTGNNPISRQWQKEMRGHLRLGHFAEALRHELQDLINTASLINRQYYRDGIIELLDYCRDATIPGSPTPHLITPEEHSTLLGYLNLLNEE